MNIPGYIGQDEAREICKGLLRKCFDLQELVELEDIWGEKEYIEKSDRLGRLDSEMASNYLRNIREFYGKRLRFYGAVCAIYALMETFEERGVWAQSEEDKEGLRKAIEGEEAFLSGECAYSFEEEMVKRIGNLLKVDNEKEARSNEKD
ncbi:hypothetical protein HOA55_00200 [archaeon]|jgi:hypothetical protein|nr:hypothetical protein [archaeon]MBT3577875.1 hypothetical protein [archaeon]MBT6819761.1 hypothetical protein [archaeon]MBT6955968.1 hypothetical protein [archaeon]MBT7025543.1 hypothetical protein [archaeon]